MKNRFVIITLTLVMLLVLAVPAQVFAADDNSTFNQSNACNTQISKIYSQLPQSAVNQLTEAVKQFQNGRIDPAKLQNLINLLCQKASAAAPVREAWSAPSKTETTVPSKETATTPANQPIAATAKPAATQDNQPTAATPAKPAATQDKPAATPAANTQTSAGTASSFGTYEQQVVDLVNKERAAAGLPALKVNTKLSGVAEKKAEDMRDSNYFSHTSPTYGSPFDMMKQFGVSYTTAGENIAKGQRTPAAVMDGWMNSSGHRANILNSSYTEIGVGYVTDSNGNTYWVQQFIKP